MTNEDLKRFYQDNPDITDPGDFVRLDENGKVPSKVLPSYVDDVVEGYYYNEKFYEDADHTIEMRGEKGKIYLDLTTNNTYRWSGSRYVQISAGDAIKRIEVTNITTMGNDEINSISCGDIVIKNENGNKHTYVVTYKEDGQGICLTYTDATYLETVSYDYIGGNWTYNSTDTMPLEQINDMIINLNTGSVV